MAAATDFFRDFETAFEGFDFVFEMAVGANGRVAVTGGDGFSVNAGGPIASFVRMALTAGLRLAREMDGRGGIIVGNYFV